jgi:hypothetical protein
MLMTSEVGTDRPDFHPALSGPSDGQLEHELWIKLERAQHNCDAAAALCKEILRNRDLGTNPYRYRDLERAMARVVKANMAHAHALAELGDYLVDGTLPEKPVHKHR